MKLIACVDADYRDHEAVTAIVGVRDWTDATPAIERVVRSPHAPAPYAPGEFYRRELPGILAALAALAAASSDASVVVIDGYVWLGGARPGLGARLHDALGGAVPIVGVAKTPFRDNDRAAAVVRGGSARPLFVTAAGMDLQTATAHVTRMHGPHRLPTILKRADRLARDA
ncbi:MAG: endonuclease V [Labilithrix sp.]|nr:endonuclease V [Labilithrix sp.]MCW5813755.1 endonuclease V [Labilithrix sp.]